MYICDLYLKWELETELEQLLDHVSYIRFAAAAAAVVAVLLLVVFYKRVLATFPGKIRSSESIS